MDTHFIFRHLEPTEGLKTYIQQKADKLNKYLMKPSKMNIVVSMERFIHRVDLTLFEKDHIFKAQGSTNDMYASIDQAMNGLEEQLKRYKEKKKSHKNYFKSDECRLIEAATLFDERLSKERTSNRVWKTNRKLLKIKKAA